MIECVKPFCGMWVQRAGVRWLLRTEGSLLNLSVHVYHFDGPIGGVSQFFHFF